MVRIIGEAVGEIGNGELGLPVPHLLRAADPQRFQVAEVADIFLDRPFVVEPGVKRRGRQRANTLLYACWASAESLQDVRHAGEGKIE